MFDTSAVFLKMTSCKTTKDDLLTGPQIRVAQEFCGNYVINLRQGCGCQNWKTENSFQCYTGEFLDNSLHGHGQHTYKKDRWIRYTNGCYYNNKLEGYAQVVYEDESHFEGLYKDNYRFGPGIRTNRDGTQDLGIWYNDTLVRLCVKVLPEWVPCLGRTPSDKAKLLQFRDLVNVKVERVDIAKEILRRLGASEALLEKSDQLYNPEVRNQNSLFFNRRRYDEAFYTNERCSIEVEAVEEEKVSEAPEVVESVKDSSGNNNESIKSPCQMGNSEDDVQFNGCLCTVSISQRFTQLCVQKNEIDLKLKRMKGMKDTVENEMKKCRFCCTKYGFEEVLSREDNSGRPRSEKSLSTLVASVLYSGQEQFVPPDSPLSNSHPETVDRVNLKEDITFESSTTSTKSAEPSEEQQSTTFDYPGFVRNIDYHEGECLEAEEEENTSIICTCSLKLNFDDIANQYENMQTEERLLRKLRSLVKTCLDQEYARSIESTPVKPKKLMIVDELMAWNNQDLFKKILRHCFLNRGTENMTTFNVRQVLCGRRSDFQKPGIYEAICKNFLIYCSEGDNEAVLDILKNFDVYPDLCDASGNTGLLYAVSRDNVKMMETLIHLGANIDATNDEGLTPLTLVISRYLAISYRFTNWAKALLASDGYEEQLIDSWNASRSRLSVASQCIPEKSQVDIQKKYSRIVIDSINNIFIGESNSIVLPLEEIQNKINAIEMPKNLIFQGQYEQSPEECSSPCTEQNYIFNIGYVKVPRKAEKKGKKGKGKNKDRTGDDIPKKKTKGKKKGAEQSSEKSLEKQKEKEDMEKEKMHQVNKQLAVISQTFRLLLHLGANANFGEVPRPPIFLSLLTSPDIVNGLLSSGADPNITTPDELLTPLHVICSLPLSAERVEICKILLDFKADPNLNCNSLHWPEQKNIIVAKYECKNQQDGKNPLHLLCMREDFGINENHHQIEIAENLILNNCNATDLYLGHTPLTLAILRANAPMIQFLLQEGHINPYQFLGNNAGNALTVYFLKRYSNLLPFNTSKDILDLLLSCNVNPFFKVYDCQNVIEFIEKEHYVPPKEKGKKNKKGGKEKKGKGSEKKTKSTSTKSAKSPKSGKSKKSKKSKKKKNPQQQLIDYMYEVCRQFALRNIKGRAVTHLYTFFEESIIEDSLLLSFAQFLTVEDSLNILKKLFNTGTLSQERFNIDICKKLAHYVEEHGIKISKVRGKKTKDKKGKGKKKGNKKSSTTASSRTTKTSKISKGSKSKSSGSSQSKRSKSKSSTKSEPEIPEKSLDTLIEETDFRLQGKKNKKFNLPSPETDSDLETYKICFQCLLAPEGKTLVICPQCNLVHMCSEECNKNNLKHTYGHNCKINFYKTEKQRIEDGEQNDEISKLGTILDDIEELVRIRSIEKRKASKVSELKNEIESCINVKKTKLLKQQLQLLENDDPKYFKLGASIALFFEPQIQKRTVHRKMSFHENDYSPDTDNLSGNKHDARENKDILLVKESEKPVTKESSAPTGTDPLSVLTYALTNPKDAPEDAIICKQTDDKSQNTTPIFQRKENRSTQTSSTRTADKFGNTTSIPELKGILSTHSHKCKKWNVILGTPDEAPSRYEDQTVKLEKVLEIQISDKNQKEDRIQVKHIREKSEEYALLKTLEYNIRRKKRETKDVSVKKEIKANAEKLPASETYRRRYSDLRGASQILKDTEKKQSISRRTYYFSKLMETRFPNLDFVASAMPFVCYSNGEVYYTFNTENGSLGAYSMI